MKSILKYVIKNIVATILLKAVNNIIKKKIFKNK